MYTTMCIKPPPSILKYVLNPAHGAGGKEHKVPHQSREAHTGPRDRLNLFGLSIHL